MKSNSTPCIIRDLIYNYGPIIYPTDHSRLPYISNVLKKKKKKSNVQKRLTATRPLVIHLSLDEKRMTSKKCFTSSRWPGGRGGLSHLRRFSSMTRGKRSHLGCTCKARLLGTSTHSLMLNKQ